MQLNHLHLTASRAVDAADDLPQADDVGRPVGDDEGVGGLVGRHVPLWWNQGPEHRYQLRGRDMFDLYHLGDHVVGGPAPARVHHHRQAGLLGVGSRNDTGDVPVGDGREPVHLQHRQKHLIELVGRHGTGRDDGDLALHPRIDDEIPAGYLRDGLDDHIEIGVLEVEDHLLVLCPQRPRQQKKKNHTQCNELTDGGKPPRGPHCPSLVVDDRLLFG